MNGNIAVIGAGTMGGGIAQVAAAAGHAVVVIDRDAEALRRGQAALGASLAGLVKRGRASAAEAEAIAARVRWAPDLAAAAETMLVIEAIVERLDIKRRLFADLAALVGRDVVLASNTSSLSITAMAEGLPHPERLIGLHFFNPVPAMKLVEVVAGAASDAGIVARMQALMRGWGKHAVVVRDAPGFIVNRVARPFYAEAFLALDEGIDAAAIDAALTGGGGFRMGPLTLADMIGHDINYAAAASVFEGLSGHTRFRPQPGQARLVEAGLLGRKSGRGVYDYGAAPAEQASEAAEPPRRIALGAEAPRFGWLRDRLACESDGALSTDMLSVDGVVMALGDGRRLAARPGLGALLDHAEDFAAAPTLVATARDEAAIVACASLAAALGKRLVLIPDRPGQIVLRSLAQIANGAGDAVMDGVAPAEAIDEAMRHGANYPVGPLAWARAFGAERLERVLGHIAAATSDSLYAPSRGLASL